MTKAPRPKTNEGDLPLKDAEQRRDAIIKRMLNTPPRQHKDEPKRGEGQKKDTGK